MNVKLIISCGDSAIRGQSEINAVTDWEGVLNALTDIITIHDNNYNIVYANSAAKQLLGISDESGEIKCFKYYHGANQPPANCKSCHVIQTGKSILSDIFEPHLNKNIEIRAIPHANGNGQQIGTIHLIRDMTISKKREIQLEESREKLQNLTAYLQNIREIERKRIAREIHDELGQSLAVLNMDVLRLKKNIPASQQTFHDQISTISSRVDRSISIVQKIITELRPVLVDKFGLQAAIEWQVEEFQDRTGITSEVISENELSKLDKDREVSIYRIVQEVLTNIMRHADASVVELRLIEINGKVTIIVEDNGIGIKEPELENPKSFGIIGMHERASFLGGILTIHGIHNKGTTIQLTVPVQYVNPFIMK